MGPDFHIELGEDGKTRLTHTPYCMIDEEKECAINGLVDVKGKFLSVIEKKIIMIILSS